MFGTFMDSIEDEYKSDKLNQNEYQIKTDDLNHLE